MQIRLIELVVVLGDLFEIFVQSKLSKEGRELRCELEPQAKRDGMLKSLLRAFLLGGDEGDCHFGVTRHDYIKSKSSFVRLLSDRSYINAF